MDREHHATAAEVNLRQASEPDALLLEAVGVPVLVLDSENRILHANPAWEEATNCSSAPVRGRIWENLFSSPEEKVGIRNFIEAVRAADACDVSNEHRWMQRGNRGDIVWSGKLLPTRNDAGRWLVLTGHKIVPAAADPEVYKSSNETAKEAACESPVAESGSRIAGRVSEWEKRSNLLQLEIARRKAIEEKLRASEETARALLDAAPDAALLITPRGEILAANETLARRFGVHLPDVIGVNVFDLMPSETAARRQQRIQEVLRTAQPVRFEDERQGLRLDNVFYPILDAEGRVTRVAVFGRDVTEERQAVDALQLSESHYRAIVEDQTEFICRFLPGGVLTFVNEAFCRCLGKSPDELMLASLFSLTGSEEGPSWADILSMLTPAKPVATCEHRSRRCGGEVCFQQWTVHALFDAKGRLVEYQSVGRDITDRKRAEAERERLIQELQDALSQVQTLRGLLPICSSCKKIRDDKGYWNHVESYIQQHSGATFSHGLCPDCISTLYPSYCSPVASNADSAVPDQSTLKLDAVAPACPGH